MVHKKTNKKENKIMKISKYEIARNFTKATTDSEYYICDNTTENQEKLKKLLMPSAIRDNKIIFPYFG